jgi:prepilin-type processing-associated H-X9-DG protein
MAVTNEKYFLKKKRNSRRRNRSGGTIINVITAVIFFGLLAVGILWLFKTLGQTSQQYNEVIVDTQSSAKTLKCQTNLRAIWQSLNVYVVSEGGFPESQEALMDYCGNTRLFKCPVGDRQQYVYIPGQRPGMSQQNVLLYEPEPVHDGRCNVLFLGGQIDSLSPEELKIAIARTMSSLQ